MKKISKDKGVDPTEFEQTVAQALFDLENTHQELKSDLKDLYINSASQIDVAGNKKAVVIHVPYRLSKPFRKIHTKLVRELEKKFSGKDVVFLATRRIVRPPKKGSAAQRPRSRTLTAVHEAMLEDIVHPAEIVGKCIRYRLDGSKLIKFVFGVVASLWVQVDLNMAENQSNDKLTRWGLFMNIKANESKLHTVSMSSDGSKRENVVRVKMGPVSSTLSLPLCTDARAPVTPKTPLVFCSYNQSSCCDASQDLNIRKQFESMNVSQPGCASLLKSILCSKGQIWFATIPEMGSGGLLDIDESNPYIDLADEIHYDTGGSSTDGSVCFSGEKVSFNTTKNITNNSPKGMCLERIGNNSFIDMVAHTDRSNRAFFANQKGQIWFATIPEMGSGGLLDIDESNPYIDLADEIHYDTGSGLMSIEIHPNFTQNGRLFASFNCDKSDRPGCGGRCACNSDVNCDPAKLEHDNVVQPCQYQTVVAEYNTIPSISTGEARRIFTMGLPYTGHHGGQIIFGPSDGYLYFMMGDGGGAGDPQNFAQKKKSLLGKVMRFDIDKIPSQEEITRLALWGNYSIPVDNPYIEDDELLPEIWASGLRNPWRCSRDPLLDKCPGRVVILYVIIYMVRSSIKNGNYGWRIYEGQGLFTPQETPGGNTSANSINPIFPVMSYNHSDVNKNEGSASITGGYFYRSKTDPCMYGNYVYGDLYADPIFPVMG
nr:HIPL1 protein-like [Tanacetum cinerariifolium]